MSVFGFTNSLLDPNDLSYSLYPSLLQLFIPLGGAIGTW